MLLVVIITFDELTYNVDERSGMVQVALVLSNPLSSDLAVEVMTNNVTALGEDYRICVNYFNSTI